MEYAAVQGRETMRRDSVDSRPSRTTSGAEKGLTMLGCGMRQRGTFHYEGSVALELRSTSVASSNDIPLTSQETDVAALPRVPPPHSPLRLPRIGGSLRGPKWLGIGLVDSEFCRTFHPIAILPPIDRPVGSALKRIKRRCSSFVASAQ